jgi:hypothetical protein
VFENPFLSDLKDIHESTGAVFSLNCFNTSMKNTEYAITNLPTRYQSEFQSVKSWLRFAFHGEDENSKYESSPGIAESYQKFTSAIYTLTGDYGCIDRFTRLGYFSGSLENIMAIKNVEHGIRGLYTADDDRASYYFTDEQNNVATRKGKLFDLENELVFIRSATRLDNDYASVIIAEINGNLCYQKLTEVFMHEYAYNTATAAYKQRILDVANWANDNGYTHGFHSDIYIVE